MATPIQTQPPHENSPLDATLAQAQSNTYFAISHLVDQMNASKTQDFLNAWARWKSDFISGTAGLETMPKVPKSYVIGYFTDPTTGGGESTPGQYANQRVQWPYPSQTGEPLLPQPPVPAKPAVVAATWFNALGGSVVTAVAGDNTPVGVTITDSNGQKWIKKSSPTPFGTAYFYEKVTA